MKLPTLLRTAAAALAFCAGLAHAAPVVYQQAPQDVSTGWTSQVGIGQGGYQTFDDFRVDHDARIDQVSWRGTYFTASGGALHGAPPNTGAWTIEFWSGNAAGPLQQLYSQDYSAALVTRTLAQTIDPAGANVNVYDFTLDLTLDFDVVAGQQYWFSVVSKSGTFSPFFSWTNADPFGSAFQRMYDGQGRVLQTFVRSGDRAFTLSEQGAPVPEPAPLALVACAGLALAMRTRRRT
ncbi:MAG: hypothetical protein U1F56_16575 [Rubrivivax sp.]